MQVEGDNRLANLLSYIEFKKAVTLEELADRMHVTTKTIRNDIKELNGMLEGSGVIEGFGGKYRLYLLNQEYFRKCRDKIYMHDEYMNSPAKRYAYIMDQLLHADKPYLTEELAYEMNVGRTTVNGDLKRLRTMLEGYNVKIKGQVNAGIWLSGDEMYLRLFILENMYEMIYKNYELPEDVGEYIEAICDRYYLDTGTRDYFLRSFILMVDRISQGHTLKELDKKYHDLYETDPFKFARKVAKATEKMMGLSISQEEVIFLCLPIAGMRTTTNEKGRQLIEISEEVAELVIAIMDRIAYEMNFHISPTDLLDEFVYHLNFMLNRMKYRFYLKNPLLPDIKQKYPVAYKMAELAKKEIEERMSVKVIDAELGFMASYFSVFLEEQKVMGRPGYHVAIVTKNNMTTIRLMEIQLKKVLPDSTTFVFYEKEEINDKILSRYDLVLSTERLKVDIKIPVVYLSEIFDETEISRKIEQIRFLSKGEIKVKSGLNSLIASLVEPETFFILPKNLSFKETVEYLLDSLIEEEMITEEFRTRMLQREEKVTMLFDENIGFPHILYEGSSLIFALGVMKREKEEEGLRIVFLLGLPNNKDLDDQVLMKIYDEIISIAGNQEMVQDICQLESAREFYDYVIKNNDFFE